MVTIFLTADPHFGHRNIGALCERPWASVEQMDAALVRRWNEVVGPQDEVWVLGDFSLSLTPLSLVASLNGIKYLVAGNHDQCWTGHPRHGAKAERRVQRYLDAGFAEVYASGVVTGRRIAGVEVVLSHLPYYGDSGHDERYASQRPVDSGLPLICGHVHNTWARMYGGQGRIRGRQINVGVDVWDYEPVPEDVLAPLLASTEGR